MGLVPLFFVISDVPPKHAFFLGWLFGAVHAMGVGYWVFHALYFNSSAGLFVSLLFVVIVLGLGIGCYFALFSYGACRFMKQNMPPAALALVIASLWTVMEFCRAHFFSGIPWALLGHSQCPWLTLIQMSDVTGVYGISFLIVLANISICLALKNVGNKKTAAAILIVPMFCLSAALVYGGIRLARITPHVWAETDADSNENAIAVVQVSVSQAEKWDPERWADILTTLLTFSEDALKEGATLVVWPETTVPFYLEQEIPDAINQVFRKYHATLLTGGPRYLGTRGNYTFHNSVYQINDGSILNIYDKIHLLPFGEYFPLGFLDVLKLRYAAPRQYSSGNQEIVFNDPAGRFGALVCFEVLFPDLTRALVAGGAEFFVNLSNDAWFGRTSEHYQHFSMSVFRAVECRRPLMRSSNTGISGFVDISGRIVHSIPPYDEGFSLYRPAFSKEITFYCRYGDVFVMVCAVILVMACILQISGVRFLASGFRKTGLTTDN